MARDPSITVEQVFAVCDAIKAEGNKPTSRAVRERLGNIGSMGTINRFLNQWKDSHERKSSTSLTLPVHLQNAILDFMEQELAAARATLEAELGEQRQEASDLGAENERQVDLIERLQEEIAGVSSARAAAEGKATQLAADLDVAHAEAAAERNAAEQARTELAKALLRLEAMPRLVEDLEGARAEIADERVARIEAERVAAVLQAQKDDLQSRLTASAATITAQRQEIADAKAAADVELARLRDEAAKALQQQRAEAAERLSEARAELARVVEDAKITREQSSAVLAQVRAEGLERTEQKQAELQRALETLAQQRHSIDTLNAALSTAAAEARRSGEEAAELRGREAVVRNSGKNKGDEKASS